MEATQLEEHPRFEPQKRHGRPSRPGKPIQARRAESRFKPAAAQ